MIADAGLLARAEALIARYAGAGKRIATTESCTGGLVAGLLTAVPGSSAVVERGFVTYSNDAKRQLLGVPQALLEAHGAVSEAVALAMATGALARSPADVAVAVTGIAGPGGGSPGKPIGTVWIATAARDGPAVATMHRFPGDRRAVREATVREALAMTRRAVNSIDAIDSPGAT